MSDPTATTPARRSPRPEKENAGEPKGTFPHQQYLEYYNGLPYLPLKWRLAWLRADHPQARVSTKLVSHESGVAVFKAEVELPEGGTATGWGAKARAESGERTSDHEINLDYIIAAENQALSRALANLGYGTQYAFDFDPPADHPPIPLPERPDYDSDREEPGIIVPGPESAASLDAEDTDSDDEDGDEEEEIPSPRGQIRILREAQATLGKTSDVPAQKEVAPRLAPTPIERPAPTPIERPVATPVERPTLMPVEQVAPTLIDKAERPTTPVAPTLPKPTLIGNPTVEERIKNIRDEALRLEVKQIYYEARQRFNYDENRVDARSRELYGKPTFELESEEAREYLERIQTASKRR